MKRKIKMYLEQEEIHSIIKSHFKIPKTTEMESDTNSGRTTFEYKTEE